MSFVHISGWVEVTQPSGPGGPVDPGWGRPGWSPVDPGFGGGAPIYPGHGLPIAPGHPGNKPPGRPILPPHIDNGLPPSQPPHIWGGGRWEILDPGWGKPPLIGLIPPDPGWGIDETPPPEIGGGPAPGKPPVVGGGPAPTPPPPTHKPVPGPGGGWWVPVDPDWGIPGCPGGKPHPPIWAWIPNPPDFSKPVPVPEPK